MPVCTRARKKATPAPRQPPKALTAGKSSTSCRSSASKPSSSTGSGSINGQTSSSSSSGFTGASLGQSHLGDCIVLQNPTSSSHQLQNCIALQNPNSSQPLGNCIALQTQTSQELQDCIVLQNPVLSNNGSQSSINSHVNHTSSHQQTDEEVHLQNALAPNGVNGPTSESNNGHVFLGGEWYKPAESAETSSVDNSNVPSAHGVGRKRTRSAQNDDEDSGGRQKRRRVTFEDLEESADERVSDTSYVPSPSSDNDRPATTPAPGLAQTDKSNASSGTTVPAGGPQPVLMRDKMAQRNDRDFMPEMIPDELKGPDAKHLLEDYFLQHPYRFTGETLLWAISKAGGRLEMCTLTNMINATIVVENAAHPEHAIPQIDSSTLRRRKEAALKKRACVTDITKPGNRKKYDDAYDAFDKEMYYPNKKAPKKNRKGPAKSPPGTTRRSTPKKVRPESTAQPATQPATQPAAAAIRDPALKKAAATLSDSDTQLLVEHMRQHDEQAANRRAAELVSTLAAIRGNRYVQPTSNSDGANNSQHASAGNDANTQPASNSDGANNPQHASAGNDTSTEPTMNSGSANYFEHFPAENDFPGQNLATSGGVAEGQIWATSAAPAAIEGQRQVSAQHADSTIDEDFFDLGSGDTSDNQFFTLANTEGFDAMMPDFQDAAADQEMNQFATDAVFGQISNSDPFDFRW